MAHAHNQFVDFLNKLTTPKNAALMEAIKKGYKACCEASIEDFKDNAILTRPGSIEYDDLHGYNITQPRVIPNKNMTVSFQDNDDIAEYKRRRSREIARYKSYAKVSYRTSPERYFNNEQLLHLNVREWDELVETIFTICDDEITNYIKSRIDYTEKYNRPTPTENEVTSGLANRVQAYMLAYLYEDDED